MTMTKTVFFRLLFSAVFLVSAMGTSAHRLLITNDTERITFSEEGLYLLNTSGNLVFHSFENVRVLVFNMDEGGSVSIENPTVSESPNLIVYITASGELNVVSEAAVKSLTLFDLQGRVLGTVLRNSTINISALRSGVYILRVETAEGIVTKKIIKQ